MFLKKIYSIIIIIKYKTEVINIKFLLIEDNYVNAKLMQKMLAPYGEVDTATNGLEGITMYNESINKLSLYEIIFLDIMMPNINGFQVLKEIRELEERYELENTKVVMTTALDDFQNVKKAFDYQCEAYLVKPITKDKIRDIFIKFNIPIP